MVFYQHLVLRVRLTYRQHTFCSCLRIVYQYTKQYLVLGVRTGVAQYLHQLIWFKLQCSIHVCACMCTSYQLIRQHIRRKHVYCVVYITVTHAGIMWDKTHTVYDNVVTFQNLREPIDPFWAQQFCEYFAPIPTTVIRLILYLMTLLALFRVSSRV